MMRISLKTRIVCLQLCLTLASTLQAADKFVSFIREEGTLELVTSQQRSFSILCADEEHKGVLTAVHNLQEDFYIEFLMPFRRNIRPPIPGRYPYLTG